MNKGKRKRLRDTNMQREKIPFRRDIYLWEKFSKEKCDGQSLLYLLYISQNWYTLY